MKFMFVNLPEARPHPDPLFWEEGRRENSPNNSRLEPRNRPNVRFAKTLGAFHPLLGERAGVRASFHPTLTCLPVHGEGGRPN